MDSSRKINHRDTETQRISFNFRVASRILLRHFDLSQNQSQDSSFCARKIGTHKYPYVGRQLPERIFNRKFRYLSIDDLGSLILNVYRDTELLSKLQKQDL
jgi:hypothetical protein